MVEWVSGVRGGAGTMRALAVPAFIGFRTVGEQEMNQSAGRDHVRSAEKTRKHVALQGNRGDDNARCPDSR